ncbi:MAG: hypothetical protein GY828_01500 [Candidatus Gracilibacteria bacterium]|nr:hypothetical protein [Candidatus Gracilibacteria bacterium]
MKKILLYLAVFISLLLSSFYNADASYKNKVDTVMDNFYSKLDKRNQDIGITINMLEKLQKKLENIRNKGGNSISKEKAILLDYVSMNIQNKINFYQQKIIIEGPKNWGLISIDLSMGEFDTVEITDSSRKNILIKSTDIKKYEPGLYLYDKKKLMDNIKGLEKDITYITVSAGSFSSLVEVDKMHELTSVSINILTSFMSDYVFYYTSENITDILKKSELSDFNNDGQVNLTDIHLFEFGNRNLHLLDVINEEYGEAKMMNNEGKAQRELQLIIQDIFLDPIEYTPFSIKSESTQEATLTLSPDRELDSVYNIRKICTSSGTTESTFISHDDTFKIDSACYIEYNSCWSEDINTCSFSGRLYWDNGISLSPKKTVLSDEAVEYLQKNNSVKISSLKSDPDFNKKLNNILKSKNQPKIIIDYKVCKLYASYGAYCD